MRQHAAGRAWLPFLANDPCEKAVTPLEMACSELLMAGLDVRLEEDSAMGESFRVEKTDTGFAVTGGHTGVLYGAYRLLMQEKCGAELPVGVQTPFYSLRMVNCWDNAEGTVERGYSGRSLYFEDGHLCYDAARMRQLGRMLASVGINGLCINNVNVHAPAHQLIEENWLPELAALADIFRPFGVRLLLSVDYAHPMRHGVDTADPLDEKVQLWWQERCDIVYRYVPDLMGFVVKADSEHRPGPFTYGRTHADGANMLAKALKPHGGVLVWRCFVYNCLQDWRDTKTDRPMAAYQHYAYLDGQFDDNVVLQIKNGPFDFQVREPVSPLFYAMPRTNLCLEVQLAQEYTGHQKDIYFMPPMWQEHFEDMPRNKVMAMAAVSNLGRDENYTGHPFAAANLFAYGLTSWQGGCEPEQLARMWAHLTYGLKPADENKLCALLMGSRRTYEKYTAPLGLCWMVEPHVHYGPSPMGYEYALWGTYHRADRDAVGIDRTAKGTGYILQYPEDMQVKYAEKETCPDLLKLFFHRMRYDEVMPDGRTLIQRIYDDHFEGAEEAEEMARVLETLPLPSPDGEEAAARMQLQLKNAREWRDVINNFFFRLSGVEDEKGRTIYR